eukprot:GEMP01027299.1.p1 GENE.GEMP01027299.1~~GEMP01027299.1.p1  ORF type:complete len:634 (+),score=139.11 GEMP01027299.1:30-1931(+)
MGKTKPPADFKKTKKKVGKSKKAPRNETRTDFKAVRINMPNQHAIASKNDATTRRNMNLTDLLGHVKHHNVNIRMSAFGQLRELLSDSDGLLQQYLGRIVEATSLAVLDSMPQVRKEYRAFLRWLLSEVCADIQPFYPFLHLQIKASLTHVDPHVRKEGLVILEFFLAHPEGPHILRDCVVLVVKLLIQMSACRASVIEARTLRILRQLLSLHADTTTATSNVVSIQEMLTRSKKETAINTSGLADLALRAYMEANDDIEGLQLKMNACALLEKLDNPPWDDMARWLFTDFPLPTHCPPNTNRSTHRALVDSVNLHIATLLASSPQHPAASPSAPTLSARAPTLAYLRTTTKQLWLSDANVDDDEHVALQSIKSKVTHILKILRLEVARCGPDTDMARIVSDLCLPKNDSTAELTSARVLLMVPFVDEVHDIFDRETTTPWLQVWPKILWNSPDSRSDLLRRILALARSDFMRFKNIQPFLLPFFTGIGTLGIPLLDCSAEDQSVAISILFYFECNWDNVAPKITPLLKSSVDKCARDLLVDILLAKNIAAPLKLRLLLSMVLQPDDSWRKAASYTLSVTNYWTSLALPLADRAREIDSSSSWLRYLMACAQPRGCAQKPSEVVVSAFCRIYI